VPQAIKARSGPGVWAREGQNHLPLQLKASKYSSLQSRQRTLANNVFAFESEKQCERIVKKCIKDNRLQYLKTIYETRCPEAAIILLEKEEIVAEDFIRVTRKKGLRFDHPRKQKLTLNAVNTLLKVGPERLVDASNIACHLILGGNTGTMGGDLYKAIQSKWPVFKKQLEGEKKYDQLVKICEDLRNIKYDCVVIGSELCSNDQLNIYKSKIK
jgi:hypothetical protein